MGAPVTGIEAAEDPTAEALLSSLKTIAAAERRKHASVFNYWLSIRGDRPFPPIRDLDPLEISDAAPFSILLEMIGGGEDADIRHLGQAIREGVEIEKISEALGPSLLTCIASKLPLVAATRQPFAFEDEFPGADGTTRCWVTLLPFSATGTWIDYVYGFVSLEPPPETIEEVPETEPDEADESFEVHGIEEPAEPEPEPEPEPAEAPVELAGSEAQDFESEPEPARASATAGFSAKLIGSLEAVRGYYGKVVEAEPPVAAAPAVPVAKEQPEPSQPATEGALQSKLTELRAKAEEARMAKLRANAALYEGLGAAYDFALDAEEQPEDYLRLVEEHGLRIQLRSPMKPVVKLAFDGMCDEATIGQLEAVLAWALKQDLPRGSLAERIEAEGGIGPILEEHRRAA